MDWFAERGEIENDINVFESLASREDLTLNETEFHSFTADQPGASAHSTDSKSTQTNVEEIIIVGNDEGEVEAVEKGGEVNTTDKNLGDQNKGVGDADKEAWVLDKMLETPLKEAGVLTSIEVLEEADEASLENLTLVLSEDDAGGDAGGGNIIGGGVDGGGEEQEQPVSQSDITLREETSLNDASSDDVLTTYQADMVASTPMVTVKKETVVEVTGLVNKMLFEVTVTEEEDQNVTSARQVDVESDDVEVGEIRQDGEAGLELSRLSGTHIEEVGEASDESWLLTGTDSEFAVEMSSDESGTLVDEGRAPLESVTLAQRLRMRSVNKYNSWLRRLNKESVGEVSSESAEDASLAPSLKKRSVNEDEESGLLAGMDKKSVGQEARIAVEGATLARRVRERSVNKESSWVVVEGAATRFSPGIVYI